MSGKKEVLDKFIEFMKGPDYIAWALPTTDVDWPQTARNTEKEIEQTPFSFLKVIAPKEHDLEHPFDPYGYDWQQRHWGTKWSASDVFFERVSPTEALYKFQTAWTPPVVVIETIGMSWPKLRIRMLYGEGGSNFSGDLTMENGEMTEHLEGEYGDHYGERWDEDEEEEEEDE